MIKHIWTVLCRRSVIDQDTNNLSLYDILEQLEVEAKLKEDISQKNLVINVPIEFDVVSLWLTEKEDSFEGSFIIEVEDPEGKVLKTFDNKLSIPQGMRRMRTRLKVNGFAVKGSGDYNFNVYYKEIDKAKRTKVSVLPLEVGVKLNK